MRQALGQSLSTAASRAEHPLRRSPLPTQLEREVMQQAARLREMLRRRGRCTLSPASIAACSQLATSHALAPAARRSPLSTHSGAQHRHVLRWHSHAAIVRLTVATCTHPTPPLLSPLNCRRAARAHSSLPARITRDSAWQAAAGEEEMHVKRGESGRLAPALGSSSNARPTPPASVPARCVATLQCCMQ